MRYSILLMKIQDNGQRCGICIFVHCQINAFQDPLSCPAFISSCSGLSTIYQSSLLSNTPFLHNTILPPCSFMKERQTHNAMALWHLFILEQHKSSHTTIPQNSLFNAGYFIAHDTASAIMLPRTLASSDSLRGCCYHALLILGNLIESTQESVNKLFSGHVIFTFQNFMA